MGFAIDAGLLDAHGDTLLSELGLETLGLFRCGTADVRLATPVAVRDLVDALILAAEKPCEGRFIVANDDTYAAFHTLLVNLFTKSGAAVALASCPCDEGSCPEDVRLFAEKAGFNPLIILTAIQLVLKAIEIIKNLKDKDPVAA